MPDDVLCDYVQRQAIHLLGDKVESVCVVLGDHDDELSVAIRLSDGGRHAVRGPTWSVRENPEGWTASACDALVAWLNVKAAGGKGTQ